MPTLNAYISPWSALRSKDLSQASAVELAAGVTLTASGWPDKDKDYVLVGTAEVTVTLLTQDAIVQRQIVALRGQQANIRATAYVQSTAIERQIQSLLAITNEVAA